MKILKRFSISLSLVLSLLILMLGSCSKSESYSELLREEERAVNWYLASCKVENSIPADSISFITGEDAPFYRLDEDGYVYMQVIRKGDSEKIEKGDLVYFRYNMQNIKYMYEGIESNPVGNSDYLQYGPASFVYQNTTLQSTTKWGTGIQMPLKFLGYNSEVNLVLKSYYGFAQEQAYCMPYLMNIRYFKPEY